MTEIFRENSACQPATLVVDSVGKGEFTFQVFENGSERIVTLSWLQTRDLYAKLHEYLLETAHEVRQ